MISAGFWFFFCCCLLNSVGFCWVSVELQWSRLFVSMDFCWFLSISIDCWWFFNDSCWFLLGPVELSWFDFCWSVIISAGFWFFFAAVCCFCWILLGLINRIQQKSAEIIANSTAINRNRQKSAEIHWNKESGSLKFNRDPTESNRNQQTTAKKNQKPA